MTKEELIEFNKVDNILGAWAEMPETLEEWDLTFGKKVNVWFTSDTHFHHKNILKYESAYRPWATREEMDEELIKRWNKVVGAEDTVFHLGDFALSGNNYIRELNSMLNGHIYLLLGNHDRDRGCDWNTMGFSKVFTKPFLLDGKYILSHEPVENVPEGKVNIYGHVHSHEAYKTIDTNRFCVCVERHGCAPVNYETIKGNFQ